MTLVCYNSGITRGALGSPLRDLQMTVRYVAMMPRVRTSKADTQEPKRGIPLGSHQCKKAV